MTSAGINMMKSVLPSSVQSSLYSVGINVIPPPYNILFDKMCVIYLNLEDANKEKMKEKIIKLIEVMPIPSKSELTSQVGVVTEICDMKKDAQDETIKGVLNAHIDGIFELMDEMIKEMPEIEKDPVKVVEFVQKLIGKISGILEGDSSVASTSVSSEWKNEGEKMIGVLKKGIEVLKKEGATIEELDAVMELIESIAL